jgi:hypothetical protein
MEGFCDWTERKSRKVDQEQCRPHAVDYGCSLTWGNIAAPVKPLKKGHFSLPKGRATIRTTPIPAKANLYEQILLPAL